MCLKLQVVIYSGSMSYSWSQDSAFSTVSLDQLFPSCNPTGLLSGQGVTGSHAVA